MTLKSVLLSAALLGSSCTAMAAPGDPVLPLVSIGGGAFGAGYVQSVDTFFQNTFDFSPASFAGLVSISLTGISGPVHFANASLNGAANFWFFPDTGDTDVSFKAQVTADMPLELFVQGIASVDGGATAGSGMYRVIVNAIPAAVPEPQTWALLIAGLGGIAFVTRRKAGKDLR
jgi:hypothetical protein